MEALWQPSPAMISKSNLSAFREFVFKKKSLRFSNYEDLHQWSIDHREVFWSLLWDFCRVLSQGKGSEIIRDADDIIKSRFFPQAKLNYAENILGFGGETELAQIALVFWSENKIKTSVTRAQLLVQVSCCAQALRKLGVQKGDRVAGYLPNGPEGIVAMLATVSLGAIWSSASPDFGVQGVLDRFGQIEPKVLFAVDGYWYNGKAVDCRGKIGAIQQGLTSLKKCVVVEMLKPGAVPEGSTSWQEFLSEFNAEPIQYASVEFNHPLFIMFSSGTTGIPKCIVHGHGGTLLQHLKEHRLHGDLKPGDRLFYFTTLGWMMWNWMVTGLASGATLLLYDGSPFAADGHVVFDYLQTERATHFGTSAKFIDAAAKMGLKPRETHDLSSVKIIFSTGSPLVPESFDYVYRDIKKDVCLSSISGGTDIIACFMLGNPELPVWRGELQCAGLGFDVQIFSDRAQAVIEEKGELVCTKSFPSMPVGFWNDPGGKKYFEAYFAQYKNVWCHGDYVLKTKHNGFVIYGRSDAVLNPGGVRIGTAEIYRQVEKLPEVLESIVVGQDWQNDVRVVLFVKLKEGLVLSSELQEKIKKTIRENTTPRHVPAKILLVLDIPRTKSGKITELAVKKVIHGEVVNNTEALANPESLMEYRDRPELKD